MRRVVARLKLYLKAGFNVASVRIYGSRCKLVSDGKGKMCGRQDRSNLCRKENSYGRAVQVNAKILLSLSFIQ